MVDGTVTPGFDIQNSEDLSKIIKSNITREPSTWANSGYVVFKTEFHGLDAPLLLFAWFLIVAAAKVCFENLHKSKSTPEWLKKFPESCLLILLGLLVGVLAPDYVTDAVKNAFTHHNFFIYILPPIIFEAAYTVPMRPLANNAIEIAIYAIFGTLLNTFLVGCSIIYLYDNYDFLSNIFGMHLNQLHWMLYAAIISAVDPVAVLAVFESIHVNTTLYILVFGESLMNDGVAVVLYQVFEKLLSMEPGSEFDMILSMKIMLHFMYIVFGGVFIGCILGFAVAYVTKYTYVAEMMEPIVVFGTAYISYLLAEGMKCSAILSIVFCAFCMRFYVHHNIANESDISIHNTGVSLAYLTEATIFLNLGIVGAGVLRTYFKASFKLFLVSISLCLVFRFMIVFVLTYFINKYYRQNAIKFKDQIIMAYGGLRGGIAFSLMQVATMGFKIPGAEHGESGSSDDSHGILSRSHRSTSNMTIDEVDATRHDLYLQAQAQHETQNILLCSTLLIILFTCFIQGTTISYIIDLLSVEKAKTGDVKRSHFEESAREIIHEVMMGVRGIVSSHHGRQYFWFRFDKFKHAYLNNIFERDPNTVTYFDKKIGRECKEISDEETQKLVLKVNNALKFRKSIAKNDKNWDKKKVDFNSLTLAQIESLPSDATENDLSELFRQAAVSRRHMDSTNSDSIKAYHGPVNPRCRASHLWLKATSDIIQKELTPFHEANTKTK